MKFLNLINCFLFFSPLTQAKDLPNIMLIMVDDMGFSDVGCYGSEISTPNLDKLARNGIRFSQFYNTSRCCPSRASLLTGLDHHKAGMGLMTDPKTERPGYCGFLVRERCTTIAEMLQKMGYGTYMVGKWHLGLQAGERPLDWGFNSYYGALEGAISFFEPGNPVKYPFDNKPRYITLNNDTVHPDENYYATNRFTDFAIMYLDRHLHEKKEIPFFIYVAYNAPHWPLQALPGDIQKYDTVYLKGWDEIRLERYQRQLNSGILNSTNTHLSERSDNRYRKEGPWPESREPIPSWSSLTEEKQKDLAKRMSVYAAMVDNIDQNIGRLVNFLKINDILENTLIIFLSDNGGALGGGIDGYNELGNRGDLEFYGTSQSFISYGIGWANVSNTPFRMYKCYVHEGGISSPLIIHWPVGIRSHAGSIVRIPVHITDIFPTILNVSGTEYPTLIGERKLANLQGQSLIPLIQNDIKHFNEDRMIFWEHAGHKAVRYRDWKLVQVYMGDWELYNFSIDRCETKNLIDQYPELADKLINAYYNWAERNLVYPSDFE